MKILIYFKESFKNIKRYPYTTMDSVFVIVLVLFLLGMLGMLFFNVQRFVNVLNNRVEIVAFLDDNINSIEKLQKKIEALPNIAKIVYVSQDDALKYITQDADIKKQIDLIGSNPLPASLNIKVVKNNYDLIKETVLQLKTFDGINDVRYGEKNIKNLMIVLKYLYVIGIIFGLFCFGIVLVLLRHIAKISVYERKKELILMPLLGADSKFMIILFSLEGLFIGFISILISFIMLFGFYKIFIFKFNMFKFMPINYVLIIFSLGILLGVLSRIFIVKRWLDR